jgi:hypothetical protein
MRNQNLAMPLTPVKDCFTSVIDTGKESFSAVIDTGEALYDCDNITYQCHWHWWKILTGVDKDGNTCFAEVVDTGESNISANEKNQHHF